MNVYPLENHSQEFQLTTAESFRIPLRRKNLPSETTSAASMYEQSLDLETFNSYLSQHTDPNESRFYDDFFNLATSHDWKGGKRLPGLPTPPSTPDKAFHFEMQHVSGYQNTHQRHPQQQHSPTLGLQVVPNSVDDHQQNDYISWLSQDAGKYFTDQQDNLSRALTPADERGNQSPQLPMDRNGQYAGLDDPRHNTAHLANLPESLLSPVSPRQNLKRTYPFNNGNTQNNNNNNNNTNNYINNNYNTIIRSPNNVISPIPRHFTNEMILNTMRSSEENYYRQLAYEKMRSQQKFDDVEEHESHNELSRATHNVLERQRRNDLKLRFNILRDNIPELSNNDKAPKIQILKKALEHLAELKSQEQKLLVDVELEKQRKIILLNRLKVLQESF